MSLAGWKELTVLLSVFCLAAVAAGQAPVEKTIDVPEWSEAEKIVSRINPPQFRPQDYDVTGYGAVGDGKTDCRPAIQAAIDKCTAEGGGRVVIPAGEYLVNGPLVLKSGVNFHVAKGAAVEFSAVPEHFLPMVLTRWEGTEVYNYSPFIYVPEATDVAVTGEGIIDGNAEKTFGSWKPHQNPSKMALRKMGAEGVPVEKRRFGPEGKLRPSLIQFFDCRNILVEGVTIKDSPFWVIHPVYCENVTVRNVTVDSWNPNNDGVDPDSSRDVLIEDCVFYTGDDSVALKSGRDQDGWRVGKPTENIVIRNCNLKSECNGLCIGSEMSGNVRRVFMENCTVGDALSAIYFKSNPDRGGVVEKIRIRNIATRSAETAFIRFETRYKGQRGNYFPPQFQDILVENVSCDEAQGYGILAEGLPDKPLRDIVLRNVTIRQAEVPHRVRYVEDFVYENVFINGKSVEPKVLSEKEAGEEKVKKTW